MRRSLGHLGPWGIAVALCAATSNLASAQERALALRYEAPASCPDEGSFRARVIARLGYDPFGGPVRDTVGVQIVRQGRGFVAELRAGDGVRSLPPTARCRDAVAAAAVTVAIVIDPLAPEGPLAEPAEVEAPGDAPRNEDPSHQTPPPSPPPTASPTSGAPPVSRISAPGTVAIADSPDPPEALRLRFYGVGSLGATLGLAPTVLPDARLGTGVIAGAFVAELAFRGSTSLGDADVQGVPTRVRYLGGEVAVCGATGIWSGCAVVEVGAYAAQADSLSGGEGSKAFVGTGLRAAAAVPLSRAVTLEPRLTVGVSATRMRLSIGDEMAWSAPPIYGSLAVALVFAP